VAVLAAGWPGWAQDAAGPKAPAAAAQDRPLAVKDIVRMRREHVALDEIVAGAQQRGVAFPMTAAAQNQLRRMGFTPDQIAALKDAAAAPSQGDARAGAVIAGQGLSSSDAQRESVLRLVARITAASGADVSPVAAQHVTLWAAKEDCGPFLADVKKVEKFLETKFKEPVRSGLDKRSAHVILLRRRYEYEKWIAAMFDAMGDRFQQPNSPGGLADLKARIQKGVGYDSQNFAVVCMERQQPEWVHRVVALGIGYMYLTQLAELEPQQIDPLATGFANGMESVLAGAPAVMLFNTSYRDESRDLGTDRRAWIHLVQQRIAAGQVSPVAQLLRLDTTTMVLPHYAEAWTLVGLLAGKPDKFAALLLALREDKNPLAVIEKIYGWDEKDLTKQWHKYVLGQR
jgi:hypothetical protein